MSDKIKVYISGPYTKGDPVLNVRNALEASNMVLEYGHVPIVPHLSMFYHFFSPKSWSDWIDYDLELLCLCDILLRLPGESTGADIEVNKAKELGLPVVYSYDECKHIIDILYCRGGY